MSIAADLAALADMLGPAVARPSCLSATGIELLIANLRDLERRVALIEAQPVPVARGGNVVSLCRRRDDACGRVA